HGEQHADDGDQRDGPPSGCRPGGGAALRGTTLRGTTADACSSWVQALDEVDDVRVVAFVGRQLSALSGEGRGREKALPVMIWRPRVCITVDAFICSTWPVTILGSSYMSRLCNYLA